MESGRVNGGGRCVSRSHSPGSQSTSPARRDFNTTQVMTQTSSYPASASRGSPLVTPTRDRSTKGHTSSKNASNTRSGKVQGTLPRRSGALPLSVGELNVCASPLASACSPGTCNRSAVKGTTLNRRPSMRSTLDGDGRAQPTPSTAIRGPAGSVYTVRGGQHPLYTGNSSANRQGKFSSWSAAQPQRRTPPPSEPAAAAGPLVISSDNNTVRSLRSGVGDTSSPRATANAAKRQSVIESVAAAAGLVSADEFSARNSTGGGITDKWKQHVAHSAGNPPNASHTRSASVRFQLPSSGGAAPARVYDSQPLAPLPFSDAMKMQLQQLPSSANGGAALTQRLPDDTLVISPPEQAKESGVNAIYAQLSSFKMPGDSSPDAAGVANAPGAAVAPAAAPTSGTAAGVTVASPAPTSEPSAVHLPPPPPSSATSNGVVPSSASPSPPPLPLPQQPPSALSASVGASAPSPTAPPPSLGATATPAVTAAAASAVSTTPNDGAAAGTSPAQQPAPSAAPPTTSPPSILHASLRKPSTEEIKTAESDRLLHDIIAAADRSAACCSDISWGGKGDASYVEALSAACAQGAATAAGRAVLYAQRHAPHQRGGLYGWQRPPANVLLPDSSQAGATTWTMVPNASGQEAQQAAAASRAIANAAGVEQEGLATRLSPAPESRTREPAATPDVRCYDYHAPFQAVRHPESVEAVDAIPDISGAIAVDAGAEAAAAADANGMQSAFSDVLQADPNGTAVKSFASQAVVLRDPLSLLACEHLAGDTVDMVARRHAYLTAMAQLNGALRGAALPPVTSRPSILHSVLQPAAPPGEVFCELSYQAKVLLSTVLYMRALGALPTLLRVGPLTEYSPIVDKENCIELVFYNPSDDERTQQEAQEAQQDRRRRQSVERQRGAWSVAAAYSQTPVARSHSATTTPASTSRARAWSQFSDREGKTLLGSRSGSTLRTRSRSLSISAARNRAANGGSAEDVEGLIHLEPSATYSQRSPLGAESSTGAPASPSAGSQLRQHHDQQHQLQRQRSAVEGLLMQSLTSVALRRSESSGTFNVGFAPPTDRADAVHGATSKAPLTGANFTSLAGPQLRSDEPSLLIDDVVDVANPIAGVHRRPTFQNESVGAWLQRSPSQEATSRIALQRCGTGSNGVLKKSPAGSTRGVQRLRRGSECSASGGAGAIPHLGSDRRSTAPPMRAVSAEATMTARVGGLVDAAATAIPTVPSASASASISLRRSSVQFAVEDLARDQAVAAATATKPTPSSPAMQSHGFSGFSSASRSNADRLPFPPQPSVQFHSTLDEVTAPPRTAAAARPVPPTGPGKARFPAGQRELCVVLRAVVAQKSHVYAFGKSETVHVLPPLPPRTPEDDVDEEALLRSQVQQRKTEANRGPNEASNPLVRFLCGTRLRHGGGTGGEAENVKDEEEIEAEKRRLALRARARRASVAAQRQAPVPVDSEGRPAVEDYGDLVVAFVLSKNASELSGSVPDMMELESLRYRIFSLQGYSSADPSGMQAVRAAAAAAGEAEGGAAPSLLQSVGVGLRSPGLASFATASTHESSPLLSVQTRLQRQLSSYTAFQASPTTASPSFHPRAFSPDTSIGAEGSMNVPRASLRGMPRRASFFESALLKTDPSVTRSNSIDGEGDHLSDSELQQLRQKRYQLQRAAMRLRYPLYRASSVAESTLEAFMAEAKAAVSRARRDRRCQHPHGEVGTAAEVQGHRRRSDLSDEESKELLAGLGTSNTGRVSGASTLDATSALQEAEKDLLRFRPMNLNSFHREMVDAVQYALDIQTRQKTETVLHAFHM